MLEIIKERLRNTRSQAYATDCQSPRHERNTFAEHCDYFEKHYVKAAEYVEGRKVSGMRSLATAKG
jgi:hypothetical protein